MIFGPASSLKRVSAFMKWSYATIRSYMAFCLLVFDSPINKIRWIHALMKPLIYFSGEAFQKNAGIAKEHMQFWQAICIFVIPSRQPIVFKKEL
jgi:hypothetical protein